MIALHHLVFGRKYAQPIPTDYILAYDFNGDFLDKSVNSNNGVAGGTSNLPTFTTGLFGKQCVNFNGTQSIKTTNNVNINSPYLTLSYWFKLNVEGGGIIVESNTNYTIANGFYNIARSFGTGLTVGQTSPTNRKYTYEAFIIGQWYHIIVTIDRTKSFADEISIYFNKVLKTTQINSTGETSGNFSNYIWYLGQRAGNSVGLTGNLQNFRAYNRILTETERLTLYNE